MQNRKIDKSDLILSIAVGFSAFVVMMLIGVVSYQSSIEAGKEANIETPAFIAIMAAFVAGWLTYHRGLILSNILDRINETPSERVERNKEESVIPYLTGEKESEGTGDELGMALRKAQEKREKYAAKRDGREVDSNPPATIQSRPIVNPPARATTWNNSAATPATSRKPASWRELPEGSIWIGYDKVTFEPLALSMRTQWLICGMTGFGKSTLIRVIAAQAIANGFEVHAVDPSLFTDYKAMDGYILPVDVSADPSEETDRNQAMTYFVHYLRGMVNEMAMRRMVMAQAGSQDISAHPEYPRMLILLDEFDAVVAELKRYEELWTEAKDMIENLCLRGRKYGINILFMVHYPVREMFSAQMKTQARTLTFHQDDATAARVSGYNDAGSLSVGEFAFGGRVYVGWPAVDAAIKATIGKAERLNITIEQALRGNGGVQHQSLSNGAEHHPTPPSTPLKTGVEGGVEHQSTPEFGDLTPAQNHSTPLANTRRTPPGRELAPLAISVVESVRNGTHPRHSSPTNEPLSPVEAMAAKMLEGTGYSQRQLVDAFYTSYNPKSVDRIKEALGHD